MQRLNTFMSEQQNNRLRHKLHSQDEGIPKRWTSIAAIETGAPAHVLTAALFNRFTSRGEADFADKLLSAMRFQFGGHHEKPSDAS